MNGGGEAQSAVEEEGDDDGCRTRGNHGRMYARDIEYRISETCRIVVARGQDARAYFADREGGGGGSGDTASGICATETRTTGNGDRADETGYSRPGSSSSSPSLYLCSRDTTGNIVVRVVAIARALSV